MSAATRTPGAPPAPGGSTPGSPSLPDVPEAARGRWAGFAALAGGLAMIVLDGTVVSVTTPAMVDDIGLTLSDAQWVSSGYAVVFAALLLTTGRLGDRHGRRLLFTVGVATFAAASLLVAAAQDPASLIGARMVQGVGGALVLPSTLSTLNATFRGRDRAVAFGLWGAVMAGAAAIGPLLGGWLATDFSWRWVFLINLPVAAVVLGLAIRFVPETRGEGVAGFDAPGLVLSVSGPGALVFGLIEAPVIGWFRPRQDFDLLGTTWPETASVSAAFVALVFGALATALLFVVERHRGRSGRAVVLDLSLFAVPTFAWGNLTAAMVAVGEFALLFVLPLYLVYAGRLSVLQAGGVLATMAGGAFVAGARARSLSRRLGPPRVVALGLVLELVATVAAAWTLPSGAPVWLVAVLLAVYGLGLGLASAQLTSTVLRDVPVERSGAAAATQSTVRQLGSAFGAALAGTVLAIGFAITVPQRLALVDGVSHDDALVMIDYMTGTAGAVISWIHAKGTDGYFGALGPQVADQLSIAFAQSAGAALWAAAVFLALGLAGALAVGRASRRAADGVVEA